MPRQIPQPWCTSQYVYLLSLLGDEDFIKSGSSFEPVNQPDPCKIYIITFILHPNPYHFDKFTFIFHFCFLQQTWQKKHMSNEKSFKVPQFWFTLSEPKSGDFSQHHVNMSKSQSCVHWPDDMKLGTHTQQWHTYKYSLIVPESINNARQFRDNSRHFM